MDSLTQFALGSAIGVAVLRRKCPVWKAALLGGLLGTLPDLDAFIDHGDPIRNMTYHRGFSHAFFYQTLAAPFLGWLIARMPSQRSNFKSWAVASLLILITHALIDYMTVYGTQIGLPFFPGAFAASSIFIIDPLYTLPLLFGLALTGWIKSNARLRWNDLGLIVSSLYLVWTLGAQHHVKMIALENFSKENIQTQSVLVTPTAFNTILWRIVAMTPTGYVEGFYSLLDRDQHIDFQEYQVDQKLYSQWKDNWYVGRMEWFTHGFLKLAKNGDQVILTDLRMGQEPYYTFNFILNGEEKPEHFRSRPNIKRTLQWVKKRALGDKITLQDYLMETHRP